jgi:riboflavin biosynthesis pyrimidine reductase
MAEGSPRTVERLERVGEGPGEIERRGPVVLEGGVAELEVELAHLDLREAALLQEARDAPVGREGEHAGLGGVARLGESALDELGRHEIQDLLVEGGPTLAGALFDAGEIDGIRLFIAPVLVGSAEARAVLEGQGVARIAEGVRPLATSSEQVGEDILVRARLREW